MDLSLGLFSSFQVDTGSMLLLKTIAQQCRLETVQNVLDVGCGVGTIGIAIASASPEAKVTLVDRDQLAVDFAAHNASLNLINNVETKQRLAFEDDQPKTYNLIVSNFPAKAGEPVLADFIQQSVNYLHDEGKVAIVLVHTLAEHCRTLIEKNNMEITHEDASKQHTVFHFTSKNTTEIQTESILKPYIRYTGEFCIKKRYYTLHTAWNISDFDSLSWRIKLLGELLENEIYTGCMVFWSPGQGHFPLLCTSHPHSQATQIILAGRDRLALLISQHNLKKQTTSPEPRLLPLSDTSSLAHHITSSSVDFFLSDLNPVPRSKWHVRTQETAAKIVRKGGKWAIIGRSSDVSEINTKGWTLLKDKRYRAWRALILKRNSP